MKRCISFDSYIKPQLQDRDILFNAVVYLLTPTSNHNSLPACALKRLLYIFWLLHQTTTAMWSLAIFICCISFDSYIKPQLWCTPIQTKLVVYLLTPTSNHNCDTLVIARIWLYIFWLLHQTTTLSILFNIGWSCISFDSYIKPQLLLFNIGWSDVVYLLTPTSNHNIVAVIGLLDVLYIFWLLHQTTTLTITATRL